MTTTDSEIPPVAKPLIDDATLDQLMAQVDAEGLGPDGVLTDSTSRIMNRALDVEMTEHIGYERGDPAGNGSGNYRNGTSPTTALTDAGAVPVKAPRNRNGELEPQLIPKRARRLEGFNDIVVSLVAAGMTTRDIRDYLAAAYQVEVSPELISKITDAVLPEVREGQYRPLDAIYPILYLDAIVVKVRTDGRVTNRPVYIAMAVDLGGAKHVLGMWLGNGGEEAKYWHGVLTELNNRGVAEVLIVCCDVLTGFGDAIEAVWPQATVQTCVVHLIRNSIRFCAWNERRPVAAALKTVYSAPTVEAAGDALDEFETEWGGRYPAIVGSVASELGPVHPVLRVRPRDPQDHLHHQRHRVAELPAPQGHQDQWLVPHRRRRPEGLLPRHRPHRPPPRRRARHPHPRLETGTQRVHGRLPQPHPRHPCLTTSHEVLDTPDPAPRAGERGAATGRRVSGPGQPPKRMMYPLVRELAGDGIPVTVSCRVLGLARQP